MKLAATVLVVWTIVLSDASAQQPPAPGQDAAQPVFRTRVELLAVDVSVVDSDGRPVAALRPSDFMVTVGGKRANVVRAEFIDFTQMPAAASAELSDSTSNQAEAGVAEPRTILLLADDDAFNPGEGKAVFMRLADEVERLFPRDPVGFLALSGRVKAVEFTTDRKPITDALRRLVGGRVSGAAATLVRVGVGEALEIIQQRDPIALEQAIGRECAGMVDQQLEACKFDVEQEARTVAEEAQRQSDQTMMALSRALDTMAALPGTKYVLFVSPGFAVGQSPSLAVSLGRRAAQAGVRLHAFFVERNVMDASVDRISTRAHDDSRLMAEGLELAVDAAGGAVHRIIGDARNAIDRVRRELSGMYRLGVELNASEADGKTRTIEVKVNRKGAVTRSYRQIVAPVSTTGLPAVERLKRALQSPLVEREIGIRVATFLFRDDEGGGRVMVSAEADADAKGLRAAFVVRDSRGKPEVAGELDTKAVLTGNDGPPQLLFIAPVGPGDHTVKLALVDAEGRVGSVTRTIAVTAGIPDTLALGDVLVLPEGQQVTRARPSARIAQGSRQASVYFEMYGGAKAPEKAGVQLEVADTPEGPALVSSKASVALTRRGKVTRATGQLKFSPAALPPGRYFARLRVDGVEKGEAVRGFTVVAGTSAALLAEESRSLVPFFNVKEFLGPSLLRAISSRLERDNTDNPAIRNAAVALEDGSWRDLSSATGNLVADSTLRGLQALAAGQAAEAERLFRNALDADPEFTIALALVGGAWASVGRDVEASRSWRTSLATGIDAPFMYPFIAESLLRIGDVKGTREFIQEVEEDGDASTLERYRALADAISGDRRETVTALTRWVDAHPEDTDASFILVLALYELKTIDKDPSAASQFEARAKQYVERGGPRRALVERWLK
jgi:VWFA-related protein